AQFLQQPAELGEPNIRYAAALRERSLVMLCERLKLGELAGVACRICLQLVDAQRDALQIAGGMRKLRVRRIDDNALAAERIELALHFGISGRERLGLRELFDDGRILAKNLPDEPGNLLRQ